MQSIDDLFRGFQADLSPLPAESRRRILTRVTTGARTRTTTRRRGRLVAVVASLAGIAAVTTAAVTLRHLDNSSVVPADTPRVNWGQVATVRVIPDVGVSPDLAMDRAVAAIHRRATQYDIPGIRLERMASDTLRMTVPAALDNGGVQTLVDFGSIAAYDRTAGRLATYATVSDMEDGLPRLTPRGGGYLLMSRSTSEFVGGEWVATKAAADAKLDFLNATVLHNPERQWEAIPVPAGDLRLIASVRPRRLDVITDSPILTAADIVDAATQGPSRLRLRVSADARPRIMSAATRGALAVVARAQGPYATVLGSSTVDADGTITVELDQGLARYVAAALGSPPVPAELRVTTSAPYGTRPPLQGEHVATLPDTVEKMRAAQFDPGADGVKKLNVPATSVLRVIAAEHNGKDASVYAARTSDGWDILYPTWGIGGGNVCGAPAGPPSLTICPWGYAGEDPIVFIGRIGDPAITRVDIRAGSRSTPATVQNGWFIALVPADHADVRQHSPHVQIVGKDDRNHELAVLDPSTYEITRLEPVRDNP